MTIKEVSCQLGISENTLRYYEKIGLIPPVPRNASGVRRYDSASIRQLLLVLKLKEMGLPLHAITAYMQLVLAGEHTQDERRTILLTAKQSLLEKIEKAETSLHLIQQTLTNPGSLNQMLCH